MKILIIGSEGFIGGFMVQMLEAEEHEVVGMDIRRTEGRTESYTFIRGDIMNPQDLKKAMQGVDLVVNLAAKHHDFGISRDEFFEINERGIGYILKAMSDAGICRFIFYSTVAVYGDNKDCSHEELPLTPSSDYGESKVAAEMAIRRWGSRDPARKAIIIRPTVVFGPHNYANMYKLIHSLYMRRFFFVGKGDNIKSVTYVENLVAMTKFVMDRMKEGVEAYNYSDYDHLTSAEIVDNVCRHLGRNRIRLRLPLAPILCLTSIIDVVAKITQINFPITANRIRKLNTPTWHGSDKVRELGFDQEIPLNQGLERMVAWYLAQRTKASNKGWH